MLSVAPARQLGLHMPVCFCKVKLSSVIGHEVTAYGDNVLQMLPPQVTTINQETAEEGEEPLTTLGTFRCVMTASRRGSGRVE
jgi:hypothetical protein